MIIYSYISWWIRDRRRCRPIIRSNRGTLKEIRSHILNVESERSISSLQLRVSRIIVERMQHIEAYRQIIGEEIFLISFAVVASQSFKQSRLYELRQLCTSHLPASYDISPPIFIGPMLRKEIGANLLYQEYILGSMPEQISLLENRPND
jgi:hypothetical protein